VQAETSWIGYTAGGYNGKVLIFEVPSLKLLKEIPAGVDLHGPVLTGSKKGNSNGTPDGKFLYAVDKARNRIVIADLGKSKLLKKKKKWIKLGAKFGPNSLDISPDGKSLCVAGELSGKIAKVDIPSRKVKKLKLPMKPAAPVYAAITRDGKFCLVSDYINHVIWVVSMDSFKVHKKVPSGGNNPHGIAVTPDNKFALISNKFSANMAFLDLASLKVVKVLKTSAVPIHTVIDSKGKFAYQSAFLGSVVKKIDIANKKVVATFPAKSRPGHLGISPDDKLLVLLNKYSTGLFEEFKATVGKHGVVNPTNIQVIDLASGKTVAHKPFLGEPFGVVLASKKAIKDVSLKGGKAAVAKGRKIDLPRKSKKVKITYGPAKPHKPGVFDMPGGSEVYLNVFSHQFAPNEIYVFKDDTIRIILQNIDKKGVMIDNPDVTHGFVINGYATKTQILLPRGMAATIEFKAKRSGTFDFYCSNWCGSVHMEMRGKFIVQ
ncbi:MAG: beta-propeller fold lactonase family protein, partial [Nitrospiria bacterium]